MDQTRIDRSPPAADAPVSGRDSPTLPARNLPTAAPVPRPDPNADRAPFRKRLSYKQARNTLLLTFLLGLILTAAQIFVDLLQLEKKTDSLVDQVLRTIQEPAAEAAYAFDRALAARVVDGLFEYRAIHLAQIHDDFGSVLAQRGRPVTETRLKWLVDLLLPGDRLHRLPLVIARHNQTVGEIRVTIDRYLVAAEFFGRAGMLLAAGAMWTVGLGVILVIMLYVSITLPVLRLSHALARVDPARPAEGLAPIPREHAEDELGILARTANQLLIQLGALLERHQQAEDRVREREARLKGIKENVADGIVTIDQQIRVGTMNRAALDLFGYDAGEVRGMSFDRCLAESEIRRFLVALARSLERPPEDGREDGREDGSREVVRQEFTGRRKTGEHVAIAFSVSQMRLDDRITFICVVQDITERKRAEAALRESEERLQLAVTATRSGVWDADLRTGESWWSPEFVAMLGYAPDELPARVGKWESLVHPDDLPWTSALTQRYLRGEVPDYEPVYRMRRRDGSWIWIEAKGRCLRDDNGVPYRFIGAMADVTERKRFEEQLMYMATHDPLTGLPNRTLLQDRLGHALGMCRRKGARLAVLHIDIDRFKLVNDSLGHAVGDALLKQVAAALQRAVRSTDTVGRLGGDEFLVIAEDLADPQDAGRIAKSVLQGLAHAMTVDGRQIFVAASIGIGVHAGEDGDGDAVALLRHADAAMHSAKGDGGNAYRFFMPAMNEEASARLALENSLREALDKGQFEPFYQLKVDVATLRPLGLEALIRWRHPEKGYIPPAAFIPVAEEMGLVGAIGDFMIDRALRRIRDWQARGVPPLRIAVNVSVRQFTGGDFVGRVRSLLAEHGIDPVWLELEVTESMMMDNIDSIIETLRALRDLGVGVAVDDFGTGHSSLAYLRRLPITVLKVDRSFINDVTTDADDAAIAATIIAMGRQLGLTVVAEGIETAEQLAFLRLHACDEAQGFHIARPIPADELERRFLHDNAWTIPAEDAAAAA